MSLVRRVGPIRPFREGPPSCLFARPAVFADVDVHSRLAQEEIFGPVVSVLRFTDEADAVRQANATRFGLTASVFTHDLGVAHRLADAVDAGYI